MRRTRASMFAAAVGATAFLVACAYSGAGAQGNPMSFFITSANPGKGADFGGLEGADRYCQSLASSVGAGGRTWHAYLSAAATASSPAVNARDRIGRGPWRNAQGVVVANSVDELHGANNLTKQTDLTEKGAVVPGVGEPGIVHDILTGSTPEGRLATGAPDTTCGNWTKSGADGSAIVGHSDRKGLSETEPARSWNSSHPTRGCSMETLKLTGSGGLLYCFAVN